MVKNTENLNQRISHQDGEFNSEKKNYENIETENRECFKNAVFDILNDLKTLNR